jgi:hypothetical protein
MPVAIRGSLEVRYQAHSCVAAVAVVRARTFGIATATYVIGFAAAHTAILQDGLSLLPLTLLPLLSCCGQLTTLDTTSSLLVFRSA